MRSARFLSLLALLAPLPVACGFAPPFPPPTPGPSTPGQPWVPAPDEPACEPASSGWLPVDEVCGRPWGPGYMEGLTAATFRDGALDGDWLFAVDGSALWVIDASDLGAMEPALALGGLGQPFAIGKVGSVLVLAAGDEGVVFVDVSDPLDPKRLNTVPIAEGPALDVFVEGTTAYVAAGSAGVVVLDVAPTGGTLQKTIPVPGFAAGVAARDGRAYVAACDTFAVVDLGLAEVASLGGKAGVRVHASPSFLVPLPPGTWVAAASEGDALFVLDMDRESRRSQLARIDLASGTLVGVVTFAGVASGVAVSGDRLYVANASTGLEVFARSGTELTHLGVVLPEALP